MLFNRFYFNYHLVFNLQACNFQRFIFIEYFISNCNILKILKFLTKILSGRNGTVMRLFFLLLVAWHLLMYRSIINLIWRLFFQTYNFFVVIAGFIPNSNFEMCQIRSKL